MSCPLMRVPLSRSRTPAGRAATPLEDARREVRRQLDQGVVGADVDGAEVLPAQAALVRDRPDDLAGFDALPPPPVDPVGRPRARGAAARPRGGPVAASASVQVVGPLAVFASD